MKGISLSCLLLALLTIGCSKKEEPEVAAPPASEPAVSATPGANPGAGAMGAGHPTDGPPPDPAARVGSALGK